MALLTRNRPQERSWDPFAELREVSDRLNRVFAPDPLGIMGRPDEQPLAGVDWLPQVNISETDKAYVIKVDLPDVKKEDVKVAVESGLLTIEGERKQEKKEENERFHRVESIYGRFVRRFSLPDDADEGSIDATHKDGSLAIRVAKAAQKQPKARQISVS
jgi:HSP20 family protein